MYEDIVAAARRSTEAAVRESQERVDLAVSRSEQADRTANEATKAIGDRWVSRINAMRRRADEQAKNKNSPELRFDTDDAHDPVEGDDLVSLSAADAQTPAFGLPEDLISQAAASLAPRPPHP